MLCQIQYAVKQGCVRLRVGPSLHQKRKFLYAAAAMLDKELHIQASRLNKKSTLSWSYAA